MSVANEVSFSGDFLTWPPTVTAPAKTATVSLDFNWRIHRNVARKFPHQATMFSGYTINKIFKNRG